MKNLFLLFIGKRKASFLLNSSIFLVNLIGLVSSQYSYPSHVDPTTTTTTNSFSSNENHLVGNLSESFSFFVAPSTIKVTYLGLNGYSLFIQGVGFSNKSKFQYDEQTNRLTILSLDSSTVGFYSAVDSNWKTFNTIVSAINGETKI